MPTRKEYVIQNYSNVKYGGKSLYIYEVRYFDDIMATGLTNSEYHYTQENLKSQARLIQYIRGNY